MSMRIIEFQPETDRCVNPQTGFWEKSEVKWMADFHFYPVSKGDYITCESSDYCYGIASYSAEIDNILIYTYCYQEEENWSCYRGDLNLNSLYSCKYMIPEDGWIRISIKRMDEAELTETDIDRAKAAVKLHCRDREYEKKACFLSEIRETVNTIREKRTKNSLVFGLMTDSHYVINGGWEDTIANLREVHESVGFDAMIHLGDLTDGRIPLRFTKEYVTRVLDDLRSLRIPVYLALGNHDANYFKNNPDWMTEEEQSAFYFQGKKLWYYIDYEQYHLRCIFLHSFNHWETIRYGFPQEEVEWVKDVLSQTPAGMKVILFSHVPLLPEMHYWSKEIRNSEALLKVLDTYVAQGGRILAYIHGHNHADQINCQHSFPIIAIGCAKCEVFKDQQRYPQGAVAYDRKPGTASQELWDVLVVDTDKEMLELIRFGAGEDRSICREIR